MGLHPKMGKSQIREQTSRESREQKNTNAAAMKAIQTIGETGEGVYDDVKAMNWGQASEKLSSMNQAKLDLKASKLSKGSGEYVDRISSDLSRHIGKKDRISAMESANELTRASMDLGQPVAATMPKELSLLDYYGRELEIGALAKDKGKMSGTAKEIKRVWLSLKPKVQSQAKSKGVNQEEARFQQLVEQLDIANSSAEYEQLASQILVHVDRLENLFNRPSRHIG